MNCQDKEYEEEEQGGARRENFKVSTGNKFPKPWRQEK